MSRSALSRIIRLQKEQAALGVTAPPPVVVPQREGGMDQYGNTTTYNLETVIVSNIKRSDYWERRASKIGDVLELIDEVYEA